MLELGCGKEVKSKQHVVAGSWGRKTSRICSFWFLLLLETQGKNRISPNFTYSNTKGICKQIKIVQHYVWHWFNRNQTIESANFTAHTNAFCYFFTYHCCVLL